MALTHIYTYTLEIIFDLLFGFPITTLSLSTYLHIQI